MIEKFSNFDALGVEYPHMPAFDADNQEELPYEDELRAYLEELRQAKDAKDDDDEA